MALLQRSMLLLHTSQLLHLLYTNATFNIRSPVQHLMLEEVKTVGTSFKLLHVQLSINDLRPRFETIWEYAQQLGCDSTNRITESHI